MQPCPYHITSALHACFCTQLQLCSGTVHVRGSWTSQARSELGIFRGEKEALCIRLLILTEAVFTKVQVTINVVLTKMCCVNLGYDNLAIQLLQSAAVTILKCTLFSPSAFLTQHRVFKRVQTGENLVKPNQSSYWPDKMQLWNSI